MPTCQNKKVRRYLGNQPIGNAVFRRIQSDRFDQRGFSFQAFKIACLASDGDGSGACLG